MLLLIILIWLALSVPATLIAISLLAVSTDRRREAETSLSSKAMVAQQIVAPMLTGDSRARTSA